VIELIAPLFFLGCSGVFPAASTSNENSELESQMTTSLTHQEIQLGPSYYVTWASAYEQVESIEAIADVPKQIREVLQTPGDPRVRLENQGAIVHDARVRLAEAGRGRDNTSNGLDLVALDLQMTLYRDLSAAIANTESSGVPERLEALRLLRAVTDEAPPSGLPQADERRDWTITARLTAATFVDVHIEALEQ